MISSTYYKNNDLLFFIGQVTVNAIGTYRLFDVPPGKYFRPFYMATYTLTTFTTADDFRFGFGSTGTQWTQSATQSLGATGAADEFKTYTVYSTGAAALGPDYVSLNFSTYTNPSGRTNIIFRVFLRGFLH